MRLLLGHKADVDVKDRQGQTAMDAAVRLLLDHGVDTKVKIKSRSTALHGGRMEMDRRDWTERRRTCTRRWCGYR